ncbi:MAG: hypothetical protein IT330_04500 [Anaerolineae bacterium]|nr:hypothetical protein [Anaerolineae bacterium]
MKTMSTKDESIIGILAGLVVLFAAMVDPLISAVLAVALLVALRVYILARGR